MPTTHILETAGEVCPFPLNEAKAAIATIPSGDLLRIDFDCTQATEAIPPLGGGERLSGYRLRTSRGCRLDDHRRQALISQIPRQWGPFPTRQFPRKAAVGTRPLRRPLLSNPS